MNNKPTSLNCGQNPKKATLIKIALDVHALSYMVCRQVDNSRLQPPQRMLPEQFVQWLAKQKGLADKVVVCYESGPFGFVLARRIIEMGIQCIVMAAQQLDERHKRVQTDQLDALQIASRLDRYLAGNTKALSVVKIPTLEQERRRSEGRQRGQLLKTRKQLEAQGRSLLVFNGYVQAKSSWWRDPLWEKSQKLWPEPVVAMLDRWRQLLLVVEEQLKQLTRTIKATVGQTLPKSLAAVPIGIGELTWALICREVLDWSRFSGRRQVSSFSGLVSSEWSSGQSKRQGHITKVGNPRIRQLLVELVWRLRIFQPEYRLVRKWGPALSRFGTSLRKKAVIAMARECAVDLWRLATEQTTPQKLGLRMGQ